MDELRHELTQKLEHADALAARRLELLLDRVNDLTDRMETLEKQIRHLDHEIYKLKFSK